MVQYEIDAVRRIGRVNENVHFTGFKRSQYRQNKRHTLR